MAHLIASARVALFNDGTTAQTVHFYDENGNQCAAKDAEAPPLDGVIQFLREHAPEGFGFPGDEPAVAEAAPEGDGSEEAPGESNAGEEGEPEGEPEAAPAPAKSRRGK